MSDEQLLAAMVKIIYGTEGVPTPFPGWNPVINWSDCGPLIVDYDVQITSDEEGTRIVYINRRHGHHPSSNDENLRRAVCLAIFRSK